MPTRRALYTILPFEGFIYENSDKMRLKHKTVLIDSSMTSGVEIPHPVVHQPL